MKTDAKLAGGKVRALICEDEPLARRALREYLQEVGWVEIVAETTTGPEAVRLIQKLEPEVIFLDVRMPEMSGLEVLDAVTHGAAVVFTTAYDEYAVTAFEHGAVDYLLKPFGKERLVETLDRVRVRLLGEGVLPRATRHSRTLDWTARLFGRRRGALVPVLVRDVVRIEAIAGGGLIVTETDRLHVGSTLTELEERLDPTHFIRVHRSHIVNLAHVTGIRRYDERRLEARLSDGSTIIASRQGSRRLNELIRDG